MAIPPIPANQTWAGSILANLNAPQSQNNLQKMAAWNACEGNKAGQSGLGINNPFNTTLNYGGGTSVNSAGVKAYPTLAVGIAATVQTLQAPRYALVVSNLRSDGSGGAFAAAVGSSGWGTSGTCIAKSLGTSLAPNPPNGGTTIPTQFNYAQLEGIWILAGGNAQAAPMAAAISMAESGGVAARVSPPNSNGTVDRGLWQINSSHGAQSSIDIMTNARAAVALSNSGQTWRPWCTAYSDGACGSRGGCYLCSGAPYQKFLQSGVAPDLTVPVNGTNAVAPGTTGGSEDAQLLGFLGDCSAVQWITPGLGPHCAQSAFDWAAGQAAKGTANALLFPFLKYVIGTVLNPFIEMIAGTAGIIAGGTLMTIGFWVVVSQTKPGRAIVGGAAAVGATAVGFPEAGAAIAAAPAPVRAQVRSRAAQARFAERSGVIGARQVEQQRAMAARTAAGQVGRIRVSQAQEEARTAGQGARLRQTTEEQLRREEAMYTRRGERGRRGIPRSTYPGPKGRR